MHRDRLLELLQEVSCGSTTVEQAMGKLQNLPFENLDFARIDSHRGLRTGFVEVVFGQGKTTQQVLAISEHIIKAGGPLFVTRVSEDTGCALQEKWPKGEYNSLANTFHLVTHPIKNQGRGLVLVVCAGTSDLPVAMEAELTAQLMGNQVQRLSDVGVAGIHRLLQHRTLLREAEVIVVVAGMEGALPSVVGGLVDCPVIAVPTSVGYGASFGGVSALLTMLNSCAPGIVVVNIDNGFGAGYAASQMNRKRDARTTHAIDTL